MIKKILKIFTWFLLVLSVLIIGLFVTSKILEDKIVQKSVLVINEQLNVPVKVKSIEFSLIKQFPNASLQLNDVVLLSDKKFNGKQFKGEFADTLIYFKELYLSVNVLALINHKLDITKAYGKQGQLNFLVDNRGVENFKIFKEKPIKEVSDSSKNNLVFRLNQIQLKQVKIRFINKFKNSGLVFNAPNYTVKGEFYKENYNASSQGKLLLHSFEQGKIKLTPASPASVLLNLAINNKSIRIEQGIIQTKAYKLNTTGLVKLSKPIYLDLKLNGNTNKLNQVIRDANANIIKEYYADGSFGVSAAVKGKISNTASPQIGVNFKLQNGTLQQGKQLNLNNIFMEGSFTNGQRRMSETSKLIINKFKFSKGESIVEGSVQLANFNKPWLSATAKTSLNLNDIKSLYKQSANIDYNGKLQGEFNIDGLINTDEDWKFNFKYISKGGQFQIKNASINYGSKQFVLKQVSANATLNNSDLTVHGIKAKVQSSTVNGDVKIYNYSSIITDSTYPIKIKSNLAFDIFRYSNFETLFGDDNDEESTRTYDIYCDFSSEEVAYKSLQFVAATGVLKYANSTLNLSQLNFNTQGGTVNGNLVYSPLSNTRYKLQTHTRTKNISVKSLFAAFNNFDQQYIKAENIDGQLTSDFELEMLFNNNKVDTSSIDMLGHLRIDDGELINFKPITEAAKFSDIEDMEHIKFSKLENDILITNSTIYIPSMKIASNAFDMELNGHQKFSGNYKYHLKINMSDFLGGKSKRLSKQQSEFGYIEDDGFGKKTLYLVATNTNNKSKVKLDRIAIRENFKSKRKQEKQEFKQALRKEFGLFKKDTTLEKKVEKDEEQEFIIEWDEE